MKPYLMILLKEFKELGSIYIFSIIGCLLLQLYCLYNQGYSMLIFTPLFSVFALPALFSRSYQKEWDTQTHYLLLSLPIRRSGIAVAKYLSVFMIGVVVFLITVIGSEKIASETTGSSATLSSINHTPSFSLPIFLMKIIGQQASQEKEFGVILGKAYFGGLLFFLGLVQFNQGIKLIFRRYPRVVTFASYASGIYLYLMVWKHFARPLESTSFSLQIGSFMEYTSLIGLVYFIIGVFLFEAIAEV